MAQLIYLTHPQVQIDPQIPVPDWGLSSVGAARVAAFVPPRVDHVVTSAERKAVETAQVLAQHLQLTPEIRPLMHENDRSATGFLPGPEFESVADAFFAAPAQSIRGWERALDAQARIVAEMSAVMSAHSGDILCVGHGAVGTLLMCHLAGFEIDRRYDQGPGGGGQIFVYDRAEARLVHRWCAMEDWPRQK